MVSTAWFMLIALTPTPSTSTRGGGDPAPLAWPASGVSIDVLTLLGGHGLPQVPLDPRIGSSQAFFERHRWLPAEHFAESRIVRVPSAYALRSRHVLLLDA